MGLLRYVERNALRAGLVTRAEDWPWSSLHSRRAGLPPIALHPWPVPRPRQWRAYVNRVESQGELEAVRRSVSRGQPFGDEAWQRHTVKQLGLEYTVRSPGRPRKPRPDR